MERLTHLQSHLSHLLSDAVSLGRQLCSPSRRRYKHFSSRLIEAFTNGCFSQMGVLQDGRDMIVD